MNTTLRVAVAVAVALIATPAANADDGAPDWTGFRLGLVGAGFAGAAVDTADGAPVTTFGIAGGMVGAIARFDYDFGRFVSGIGVELTYSNVDGAYVGNPNSGAFRLNRTISVLFRSGIGFGANLVYVQGGFNFSRVTSTGGPAGSQDTDTVTFHSGIWPGYGRHIGAGVEHSFGPALSGFVEYRRVAVGDEMIDLGPTNPGTAHFVAAAGNTIRAGITFRFGQ